MKIGRWPLVAAAVVVLAGAAVVLRKRRGLGETPKLHLDDVTPEQAEARKALAQIYTLDKNDLKRFLDHDALIVELPSGVSNEVALHRRDEAQLTVEEFVTRLENLAGVDASRLAGQNDSTKKLILNFGYSHGLLPAWAGQWWHRATQSDDEPDFREFDELLAQHTKK